MVKARVQKSKMNKMMAAYIRNLVAKGYELEDAQYEAQFKFGVWKRKKGKANAAKKGQREND